MLYSMAPMEGITGSVFRRAHAEVFGTMGRYYTPFVSPLPKVGGRFVGRNKRELDPAANAGLDVVPQLLGNDAGRAVWAAGLLAQMGYKEVNLNLGCPSGTVVAKGKGAGMLRDPHALEAFLQDVCERSPLPVSVKTRIGIADDSEFDELLDVYSHCPLAELIVHPRVQKDLYRGAPRQARYGEALEQAPFPVAYNGDIRCAADAESLTKKCPRTRHIMLGRGLLANPALARELAGGPALTMAELRRFHDALYDAYTEQMGGNAVARMKEWWGYAEGCFADPKAVHRALRKARCADEYEAAVEKVFLL